MEWIKKYSKTIIILLGVYGSALTSLIQSNYNYIDDMGRVVWGYSKWSDTFSRYISDIMSHFVHAGFYLSDISPLLQIIAILLIVLSIIPIYAYTRKKEILLYFSLCKCRVNVPDISSIVRNIANVSSVCMF